MADTRIKTIVDSITSEDAITFNRDRTNRTTNIQLGLLGSKGIIGTGKPSFQFANMDEQDGYDQNYQDFIDVLEDGIYLATNENETAGIHLSPDQITLWSPANSNALVFYNEDTGRITWCITGGGIARGFSDPLIDTDLTTKGYVDGLVNNIIIVAS